MSTRQIWRRKKKHWLFVAYIPDYVMIFSCWCCCFLKSLKSAILTALVLVTGRCFDSDWQNIVRKNVTILRQSLEQQPQEMRWLHVTVLVKNRVLAVVNWFRAQLELTCDQAVLLALAPTFALSLKKKRKWLIAGKVGARSVNWNWYKLIIVYAYTQGWIHWCHRPLDQPSRHLSRTCVYRHLLQAKHPLFFILHRHFSGIVLVFRKQEYRNHHRNKVLYLAAVELRSVIECCWSLGVVRSWTIIARSKTRAKTGWNFSLIVRIWKTSYSFRRYSRWEKWTRKRKVFTGTRMRKEQVT